MKKLKDISIFIIILFVVIIIVLMFINMIKFIKTRSNIKNISNLYSNTIQDEIKCPSDSLSNILDLATKIDDNTVVGIITIDKINFKGLIYEGTNLSILKMGVGHFSSSPFFNGNVCLAAHNTSNFWANLKNLSIGDIIEYTSFLGKKTYSVFNYKIIDETDFSLLKDTDKNIITLITCVKNQHTKRLCVQANEI